MRPAGMSPSVTAVVAALTVCAGFHQSVALADGSPELVGRWPFGPAYAVAVSGDHAYIGSGTALLVLDVSNPAHPELVGQVALPDVVWGVAMAGGFACVADDEAGLRVVDVRVPSSPVEVRVYDTPGHAWRVALAGGYAFVADGDAGMEILPGPPVSLLRRWHRVD